MQFLRRLPVARLAVWRSCTRYHPSRAPGLSRCYSADSPLADHSQVVVCGGGIVGCSVAYHLAKLGWSDVVLLEQGRYGVVTATLQLVMCACNSYLACEPDITIVLCYSVSGGTTWHAAGLINPLKGGINDVKLSQYAIDLFPKLEQETDVSTGMSLVLMLYYHRNASNKILYPDICRM